MKRETALQEVRDRISATDYLEKSKGGLYCCPICGSGHGPNHTGAVKFYPQQNKWHCHACGQGGDVIDAYRAQTGADFNTALTELAASIGIDIDPGRMTAQADFAQSDSVEIEQEARRAGKTGANNDFNGENDKLPDRTEKTPQKQKQAVADYSDYYQISAGRITDPAALSYLQGRGISTQTAAAFNIGFDPQADPAAAPGATGSEYKAHPQPRIIIPCTPDFYIARATDPRAQYKAPNPKGSSTRPFNAGALYSGADTVYICEGVFDALSIIEAGGAAIALNGKGNGRLLLQQLQEKPTQAGFVVAFDNDADPDTAKQTQAAADELTAGLKRLNYNAIRYNIAGQYKDANELLQADPAALLRLLREAAEELHADDITRFLAKVQTDAYKPHRTGLNFFDDLLLGGVVNQSVLLLLAAPAAGKTTLCAQLAECMATHKTPVVYINLEMSREQMLAKAISARLYRKGYYKTALQILQGYNWTDADRQAIQAAAEEYRRESLPYIRYNPADTGSDLNDILQYLTLIGEAAKAAGKQAPAVIIDYLHLIGSRERIEPQELIKQTVVGLKQYAVKYDTFVIAISAVNREAMKSGRITIDNGRDSSNIEYTGDYVLSLNYEALDNGKVKPGDVDAVSRLQQEPRRAMMLRVLKGRLAITGRSERVLFDAAHNTFYGMVDDFTPQNEPAGFILDDGQIGFDDPLPGSSTTLKY